jgi:predicted anti-sigma-YlaC factor YlaD
VSEDEFAHFDGAYVLGALSPEERDAYEAHLIGCAQCRQQVEELADLPALLALVPAEAFDPEPVERPDPVLPLIRAVRARRIRRRWIAGTGAALVAACLVLGTVLITRPSSTPAPDTHPVAMAALGDAPIHATADVKQVKWGTSIKLLCSYDEEPSYPAGAYTLVVQNREGVSETVGTWNVLPGKTMAFTGGTATALSDIKKITVGTTGGATLLQLVY